MIGFQKRNATHNDLLALLQAERNTFYALLEPPWQRLEQPAVPQEHFASRMMRDGCTRSLTELDGRGHSRRRTEIPMWKPCERSFLPSSSGGQKTVRVKAQLQGCTKKLVPGSENSSAQSQPAQASHARLVLNKTVTFFCTTLYKNNLHFLCSRLVN